MQRPAENFTHISLEIQRVVTCRFEWPREVGRSRLPRQDRPLNTRFVFRFRFVLLQRQAQHDAMFRHLADDPAVAPHPLDAQLNPFLAQQPQSVAHANFPDFL